MLVTVNNKRVTFSDENYSKCIVLSIIKSILILTSSIEIKNPISGRFVLKGTLNEEVNQMMNQIERIFY